MPIRIYIAPQIGAGVIPYPYDPTTWTDTTGPYRSLLNNYINVAAGECFDEIDHPVRRVSICTVEASAATLTAIEADSRVTPVIPIRATDRTHLTQILSAPFSSYPLTWCTAAKTKMEGWGINMEWITASHTMKDVLRQVVKIFSTCQVAFGSNQPHVLEFLKGNLGTSVSAIPVAQRDGVATWLQARGIDTSWITGTTTVREVVALLPANFGKLYGRENLHKFAGEDF